MKCLNCGHIALKKYCPQCGQKTSTHRFTLSSIFDYAVLNAYLSLNAGLLFTVKELFLRPGKTVFEYLKGKRTKYTNAFSFFLVALALSIFLKEFEDGTQSEFAKYNLFEQYPRFAQILLIPFLALTSYVFHKKTKLYLAEHLVVATYILAMQLVIMLPFSLLELLPNNTIVSVVRGLATFVFGGYFLIYYYQVFVRFGVKKKKSILYAFFIFITFYILIILFISLLGTIILGWNTDLLQNLFPK